MGIRVWWVMCTYATATNGLRTRYVSRGHRLATALGTRVFPLFAVVYNVLGIAG